ncbi:MAG: hypothetical protein CMA64_07790 [Euryarchaeota archaeon]|nr:hypothetical protein [Euryarchaeota archaeon]
MINKLAICGCSFVSDFDTSDNKPTDLSNSDLWNHRLPIELGFTDYKVFGKPGSSMFRIFLQVEKAIEQNYNHILILLTSPHRINYFDEYGTIDSNNANSNEVQDFVKTKYFNEEYYKKISEIISYTMFNLCKSKNIKVKIYKNLFDDCKDYSNEYIDWGPSRIINDYEGKIYIHQDSPNHLNKLGQDEVLKRFLQDLNHWKLNN